MTVRAREVDSTYGIDWNQLNAFGCPLFFFIIFLFFLFFFWNVTTIQNALPPLASAHCPFEVLHGKWNPHSSHFAALQD